MTIFESPYGDIPRKDLTITERVFQGLETRPGEVVLTDGPTGRTVTAAEVMAGIRQLAGGLAARGIGPGRTVALMAPNIPEFVTVFHAAVYAGATVTTINPTYTAFETRHQLLDAGAGMLITVPAFAEVARAAIEGTGIAEVVVIGGDGGEGMVPLSALMGAPLAAQVPVDLDEHIAVLPYSSGTTGLPKGVMLTHRNLVVNVDQFLGVGEVTPGEATPAFLPFFHIYGLQVLVNAYLTRGAHLVTMPRFDLEQFLCIVQDHRAKRLWIVPPVAIALAKHPLVDTFDLSSVVQVNSAAAPLGADLGAAVQARLGCAATQAYGMTEMSPASHVMPLDAPRAGSVGRTVPGTQCRIVDPDSGADLGVDAEGELWVKGPQVMKGYLNNPGATAQNIVQDGWLRTGDIACIDADGYLFIRDRVKELIKFKGFQIAPAELEAVLVAHEKIADAAVIGLPDDDAGEVPMAFVVAAPGVQIDADEVTAHIGKLLSHYKQLHRVDFVTEIPKSASGKILRRVLRDRVAAGLAPAAEAAP